MRVLTLFTTLLFLLVALVSSFIIATSSSTAATGGPAEEAVLNREFIRQTHLSHHSKKESSTGKFSKHDRRSMLKNSFDQPHGDEPFLAASSSQHLENNNHLQRSSNNNNNNNNNEKDISDSPSDLISIFFMHRHGARASAIVVNNVPNYNGCVLSPQGELMAKSLGRFLNERYNGTAANGFQDKTFPFFPNSYDPFKVNSWSTDFERTIRTGAACLQSMFTTQEMINEGKPAVAPYLQHLPQDVDFMLSYYYSWPAALLHQQQLKDFFPRMDKYTRSIFSEENLTLIGDYLNASKLCQDSPTTCVVVCEDFVACELSNNPNGTTPLLDKVVPLFPKLEHMYHLNVKNNYFSVPSSSFWRGVGFFAAEVIRDIMRKARAAMVTPNEKLMNDPATPVIHHYSAHDVTVYGLLVALGVIEEDTTNMLLNAPPFTATTLFELYRNGTMKFFYVICNQTYNSDHKFRIQEGPAYRVNCMKPTPPGEKPSKNLMYKSNTCPFKDIERAVNYTMETLYPKTSAVLDETMCYADPADQDSTSCHPGNQTGPNSDCQSFRAYCQDVACSPKWMEGERFANYSTNHDQNASLFDMETYLFNVSSSSSSSSSSVSSADFQCVSIVEFPGEKRVPSEWASVLKSPGAQAGVFFMSVLLGIVFGAGIGAFWVRRSFFMVVNKNETEQQTLLESKHNTRQDENQPQKENYKNPRVAYATDADV